jgi:uncharacterized protein YdhG (YjbR/CyaY superfamily)
VRRKPTTIDEYLATVKGEKRAALDKLRKTIRTIASSAEECISYGIPAFRLDGRALRTLADELEDYAGTKSSLHFDPAKPLPAALVRKLIRARIAEV